MESGVYIQKTKTRVATRLIKWSTRRRKCCEGKETTQKEHFQHGLTDEKLYKSYLVFTVKGKTMRNYL